MNENDSIQKYMNPILMDTIQNLVFYIESKGDQIYKVANIETQKEKKIEITLSYAGYYMNDMDSINFVKNGL